MDPAAPPPSASKLSSSKIRKYLQKTVAEGEFFNGTPFRWNSTRNRIEVHENKWRLFHWAFNLMVAFGHIGFVFVRTAQIHLKPNVTTGEVFFMKFQATYFLISLILHIGVITKIRSIPRVINMALDFADEIENKYVKEDAHKPMVTKIAELILETLHYGLTPAHCFLVSTAFILPQLPHLPSSLMANPHEISLTRILCILHSLYMEYVYHCSCTIIVLPFFPVVSPIMIILNELRAKTETITKPRLRNILNTLEIYKCLEVLMTAINDTYCTFIIPAAKAAIITAAAFCTYGAVRLGGMSAIASAIVGFFTTAIILTAFVLLAELHRTSSLILRERKQMIHERSLHELVQRELKALNPVKAVLGTGMYFVDRRIVITMVDTIINEATGILLVNN